MLLILRGLLTLILTFFLVSSCQQGQKPPVTEQPKDTTTPVPGAPAPDTIQPVEGGDAEFFRKKRESGIDFFAVGQEPGWSLNMDMENGYSFSTYEGISMNTPPVKAETTGDTTRYHAQVEMGELIITMVKGDCFDIMSGQKFSHSVTVKIKRGIDKKFKTYKGCGAFLH